MRMFPLWVKLPVRKLLARVFFSSNITVSEKKKPEIGWNDETYEFLNVCFVQ